MKKQKCPKQDTSNDLDWFQTYPITSTMESFTKFNTPLAQQIFDFVKLFLVDFAPGQINKNINRPDVKYSFNYLIKQMAGQRPKFLTELIYEQHSSVNKDITIPFEIAYTSFKNILSKFTHILFTKLNYTKIFALYNSIPPYTITNRYNVALNSLDFTSSFMINTKPLIELNLFKT